MNKYMQIAICVLLGAIITELWNFPGRYIITTIPTTQTWCPDKKIAVLLDTSSGRIRPLIEMEAGFNTQFVWGKSEPFDLDEWAKRNPVIKTNHLSK